MVKVLLFQFCCYYFFPSFIKVKLTNKIVYFEGVLVVVYIHIHYERITTIKLMNISDTSHSYYLCVYSKII